MALSFIDPAEELYAGAPPAEPQRHFTLSGAAAARLQALAERFGSTAADELATALQLHFDETEEASA
jgi:hypothetical protein